MEEKDTKTITMPLHEFEEMRVEIQRLKIIGIHSDLERYVGVDIEYLKELYKINGGIPLVEFVQKKLDQTTEEKENLLKENTELKSDLYLLRKEYDVYYNRCVELKKEISKLQKNKRWQFWKKDK